VSGLAVTHDGADLPTPASASFTLRRGEVAIVLGPSGSGKSTLALTLNGLVPHALPAGVAGSVVVDGHDTRTTPVSTLSRHVGMVFQDPDAQLVTGTLLDEVAFGPENLRLPAAEVLARAEHALRRVGLWDRRGDNPDRLSGGGRQRLALAGALAMGSPLLVLDEPTANLDPAGIEEVYATLAEVVAAGDRAIVLIEHNLDAAVGITDRVIALDAAGCTRWGCGCRHPRSPPCVCATRAGGSTGCPSRPTNCVPPSTAPTGRIRGWRVRSVTPARRRTTQAETCSPPAVRPQPRLPA
jgi:energy-coupling factor transport system ATP-binding protein